MLCVSQQEAKPEPEPPSNPTPTGHTQSEPSSGDPEMDKKIKNIKKVKKKTEVCG